MTSRYPGYDALADEGSVSSGPIRPHPVAPGNPGIDSTPRREWVLSYSAINWWGMGPAITWRGPPEPYSRRAETTNIYIYILEKNIFVEIYLRFRRKVLIF